MKKLYLLDGSGYIFRAYYGMARDRMARLTAKDGTPTNAVYVFNTMLQKLLKDVKATDQVLLGIAFDQDKPNFRHRMYPEYKANRDKAPEDLVAQIPLIHELVDAYDIPLIFDNDCEADDTIATYARIGREKGYQVTLISADKDLMQLVSDDVKMWDPMRDQHYGRAEVKEKFGVWPEQLGDYLALLGDAVDNVPGVPKVGKKTAEELLAQFGSLEAVLERSAEIAKKSIRETIEAHKEDARLSRRLVSLKDDVEVAFDEERLRYTGPLREKLAPLFDRLSFSNERVEQAMATRTAHVETPTAPIAPVVATDAVARAGYAIISDRAALEAFVAALGERFSVEVMISDEQVMRAELIGLALCGTPGRAAYIPLAHRYLGVPKQMPLADLQSVLSPVLASATVVGSGVKEALHVLRTHGMEVGAVGDDVTLLSYVLDPGRESHSMDYLARIHLGHENVKRDALVGKGKSATFDAVELSKAAEYAAERADVSLQLCERLAKDMPASQDKLYRSVELPLLRVLFEMEHAGIAIDPSRMAALGKELDARMKEIYEEIKAIAGMDLNINSPKQLAELLFNKLQLTVVKRTKSGPSTDMSVLEALASEHPLPQKILDYRQVQKLLSTYVETLPTLVNPKTGRVHTTFNQALAATGRLSSQDPNLQNIPIKSDLGRRIRGAFVAAPGSVFVSADYSQIELRMLAHLSQDTGLIDAFKSGFDVHDKTAMTLFNVGKDGLTPDMRRRAKAVNYGLLYGLSAFRLSREEGVSIAEAKDFINAYFGAYPSVRKYIDDTVEAARRSGYVETILGRRRYLPDLGSRNHVAKQAAERMAMNTPIQGSAADLVKLAMLRMSKALADSMAVMLLQVHDELVIEAPATEAPAIAALVKHEMESALELRVPLVVTVSTGSDWSQVH